MHNKVRLSTRHPPDIHLTFQYTPFIYFPCGFPDLTMRLAWKLRTKTQKTCLIFGYVIFLLYLCTRFREKVISLHKTPLWRMAG